MLIVLIPVPVPVHFLRPHPTHPISHVGTIFMAGAGAGAGGLAVLTRRNVTHPTGTGTRDPKHSLRIQTVQASKVGLHSERGPGPPSTCIRSWGSGYEARGRSSAAAGESV